KQWEKATPKHRCQCHACGECEGQCQNYSYLFHDSAPFLLMGRLPEQGNQSVTAITFWRVLRQPIEGRAEHQVEWEGAFRPTGAQARIKEHWGSLSGSCLYLWRT